MGDTPSYITSLLTPSNGQKARSRKVWSIDLEQVWLPFFHATNVVGETHLPPDALGAPLRLAYNLDGSVKFSKAGRPVMRVAKDLNETIRLVRDNFTANLVGYSSQVVADMPDQFKHQLEVAHKAGQPIINADKRELTKAVARANAEAIREAKQEAKAPDKVPALATA